jgi:hypothetical protein
LKKFILYRKIGQKDELYYVNINVICVYCVILWSVISFRDL